MCDGLLYALTNRISLLPKPIALHVLLYLPDVSSVEVVIISYFL